MSPTAQILLDATAILTIASGTAGLFLSLGLIFFPERTRRIDAFLSRTYQLKERLAYFDQTIRDELFIYRHPTLYGGLFVLGAFVTLIFLFFQLDVQRLLWEMGLDVLILTGKMAGVLGVVIGLFLMTAPGRLQRIEKRLNAWIATQPLVDRLDVFNQVVNVFSFRHPKLMGSIGVLLSAVLILLSLANFF